MVLALTLGNCGHAGQCGGAGERNLTMWDGWRLNRVRIFSADMVALKIYCVVYGGGCLLLKQC